MAVSAPLAYAPGAVRTPLPKEGLFRRPDIVVRLTRSAAGMRFMIRSQRGTNADPALMLAFLRGKASDRKLRLFACACCRLVWPLLPSPLGHALVESAECRADGRTALPPRQVTDPLAPRPGDSPALYAEVASIFSGCSDAFAAALVTSAMAERADPRAGGRAAQAALLADFFGRPSQRFNPRWRTPEVEKLARTIYDARRFEHLPRLASLLQNAGCCDLSVLDHCRSRGEHGAGAGPWTSFSASRDGRSLRTTPPRIVGL